MRSVNRVTIAGNLGRDPEIKTFDDGFKVARLSIATTERWTNRDGSRGEKTEWHSVSVVNPKIIAAVFEPGYAKKGDPVFVEGKLCHRSYEKDGVRHFATEVQIGPSGTFSNMGSRKAPPKDETEAETEAEKTPATAEEVPF